MPFANEKMEQLVRAYIPVGAELAVAGQPVPHSAIYAEDMDGDGYSEITAVYRLNGELRLLLLKYDGERWSVVSDSPGRGYQITVLTSAPLASRGGNNLIVGWQVGSIWSKLSVYEWTPGGLRDVAPEEASFSYMEVVRLPDRAGPYNRAELALWSHDTGEAYRIDVLRRSNGQLEPNPNLYSYYFPKVVRYYESLTRRYPSYPYYWYYLADAQLKSGITQEALISVRRAIDLNGTYPSQDTLIELQEKIERELVTEPAIRAIRLFPASVKTTDGVRWGYIDTGGHMIIHPQFEYVSNFQKNGLASVQVHGRAGLINQAGQYVVRPEYDSISDFSEGRAVVIDKEGFKLMDEAGRIVTRRAYSYISAMKDGRAMFYNMASGGSSLYGYLDGHGNEVIPAQFMEAYDFKQGKAVVKIKDNEFALIDRNGQRLATYKHAFVGALGDGLLAYQEELNGKYGYISEHGDIVMAPAYTGAQPFQDRRAIINTAENYQALYGVIDKHGSFIVQPGYNEIRMPGEHKLALGKANDPAQPFLGSTFAIADWNGQLLTDFRYTDVGDYYQGLASASDRKQTYFIDRSGKPAPGYPRVNGSGTVSMADATRSLIAANVDQRLSYLDLSGRVVWQQNTIIPLRPPYRVHEVKYKPNKDYLVYYPEVEGMPDRKAQQKVNAELKVMSQVKPVPGHNQLNYSYSGDFEVSFFKKNLLVLQLTGYNFPSGAAHGMPSRKYAHINVTNGAMYELKDLFKPGSDYAAVLSAIVGKQIKADPQYSYVFPDTYKGIKPDQPFYVTDHALHLYFEPYEIAPYAAGFPTFTILFHEIINIIAVNGPFWNSFH